MDKKKFNVMRWDFNSDKLVPYDVLPYFRDCYKEEKNQPLTMEAMEKFIERKSHYMFWSRCEYEMIVHGWPVKENEYKLDVHEQIMMNVGLIAEILYNEFGLTL